MIAWFLSGDLVGVLKGLRLAFVLEGLEVGVLVVSEGKFCLDGVVGVRRLTLTLKGDSESLKESVFDTKGEFLGTMFEGSSEASFWIFFKGELVPGAYDRFVGSRTGLDGSKLDFVGSKFGLDGTRFDLVGRKLCFGSFGVVTGDWQPTTTFCSRSLRTRSTNLGWRGILCSSGVGRENRSLYFSIAK